MQPLLNLKGVIQVRIVHQAFPADCGARLFKVDTHDDIQRIGEFIGQLLQATGIVHSRNRVVDGAGANHYKNAMIATIKYILYHLSTVRQRVMD